MYLGIDIGSVSLNLVLVDLKGPSASPGASAEAGKVLRERYVRTRGKPLETALEALEALFAEVPPSEIEGVDLVAPDPTTGVSGIKWDVEDDFNNDGNPDGDSREFSFTLDAVYPVGTTDVAVKTGGQESKTDDDVIAGPHCGDVFSDVTFVFGNHEEPEDAITLASFTATAGVGAVNLAWETGTEVDNAGFNLYRAAAADGPYTKVNTALIAAEGDPVSGASYTYLDQRLLPGTYYYKLEDVDLNGVVTTHGPVSATILPRFRRPTYRPTMPQN